MRQGNSISFTSLSFRSTYAFLLSATCPINHRTSFPRSFHTVGPQAFEANQR